MKALILALSLTVAAAGVLAQTEAESSSGNNVAKLQKIKDRLGLTDEQVSEMREIREAGGSREDVRAVLSPEQQAKAAKLRQAQKGKGGNRTHRLQQLDLSDEQMTQIRSIRKEGGSREEVRAVLTPAQQTELNTMREKSHQADMQAEQ